MSNRPVLPLLTALLAAVVAFAVEMMRLVEICPLARRPLDHLRRINHVIIIVVFIPLIRMRFRIAFVRQKTRSSQSPIARFCPQALESARASSSR